MERLEELNLLSFVTPPYNVDLWFNPAGMASGDLDSDGDQDLVVANANLLPGTSDGRVYVLLNNGDGSFAEPVFYDARRTTANVVVADFDLDGDLDIASISANRTAITTLGPGWVNVYDNDGFGNFTRRPDDIVVGWDSPMLAVGDFNVDGYPDLVVPNVDRRIDPPSTGEVMMLVNDGAGGFGEPVIIYQGRGPDALGPGGVVVKDFNFDGLEDLAISSNRGRTVTILLGIGDGTFAEPIDHTIEPGPYTLRAGDFNGDGITDLVAPHGRLLDQGDNLVSLLIGNGDGTFTVLPTHPIGENPLGVATGDFNGDFLDDIVVSSTPASAFDFSVNRVTYGLSLGDGTFQNSGPLVSQHWSPFGVWVDDFNGDFCLDFVASNSRQNFEGLFGSISIFYNDCAWSGPGGAPGGGGDLGAGLAYLATLPEEARFTLTGEAGSLPAAITPTCSQESVDLRVTPTENAVRAEPAPAARIELDRLFGTEWLSSSFEG